MLVMAWAGFCEIDSRAREARSMGAGGVFRYLGPVQVYVWFAPLYSC